MRLHLSLFIVSGTIIIGVEPTPEVSNNLGNIADAFPLTLSDHEYKTGSI